MNVRFIPFASMVCVAACVGGDDTSNPDSGAPDTGSDTTTSDVANDTGCTPSCVDVNTLSACPTQQVACALGCSTSGGAHCQVLQPQSPVTAADLSTAGVSALTISTNAFINTDTGVIDIPTVSTIRAANADPSTFQIISGIGYQLFAGVNVGVFTVGNFTINDTITLTARGNAAFALASSGTIVITGVLDARGYTSAGMLCGDVTGGPGGGVGSATGNAPGTGGGQGGDSDLTGADQTVSGGGGGGGYGGVGGVGGNGLSGYGTGGGTGGIVASLLPTIAGGFGGGDSVLGKGGGGGGGVQLVAATSITVGGGSMTGGINAGGCSSVLTNGYGGGGSGGTILLETPVVTMQTMGVLGANGGSSYQAAQLSNTSLNAAGSGSAGTVLSGVAGQTNNTNPPGGNGFGGGGGAGRIRIENKTGSFSPAGGAIVTPALSTSAAVVAVVNSQ